jgi:hypothetical protein
MGFAKIVRSSSNVRNAFSGLRVHGPWWQVILALHGKPTDIDPYTAASRLSLVRGFRFYGYLYSLLAAVIFAFVPLILCVGIPDANFWSSVFVASSLFLSCTCQLAFAGSRRYFDEPQAASLLLLTFFVSIMACLCGVCFAFVHLALPEYDIVSSIALALLMIFGIGSYFIEILFLASNDRTELAA